MTATENIIDSIDSRLRQLNDEINTLTAARAALDGRDSPPAVKRRPRRATRAVTPENKRAGTRAAVEPVGEPVSGASRDVSHSSRQRTRSSANGRRRQKRRTVEDMPAERLELVLLENGDMTTSALAESANANRDQILTLLRELEAAERIRRTGHTRATRWHAITDEERIQERAAELASQTKTASRRRRRSAGLTQKL